MCPFCFQVDAENATAQDARYFYLGVTELSFADYRPLPLRHMSTAFAPYSIHTQALVASSVATAPVLPAGRVYTGGADVKLRVSTDYHADAQWRRICIGVSGTAALTMAVLWCALSRALLAGLCWGGIVRLRCMAC
jgi:hypothetical protein